MDFKRVTIDGIEFSIYKLPLLEAMTLDKKVTELLLPILSGLTNLSKLNLDEDLTNIDLSQFGGLFSLVSEAIGKMNENEFISFVQKMCKTTQAVKPGLPPVELSDYNSFDKVMDSPLTVYKLLLEIMRVNKFSPFELAGAGLGTKIMSTFGKETETEKELIKNLEESGISVPD